MDDESKRFHLLIGEPALLRTVSTPQVMTAWHHTLLDALRTPQRRGRDRGHRYRICRFCNKCRHY
ncbi:hypothetical protein ACFU44_10795 [Nocardia rhizosphaerihabitans]|uniref:hypothetical protein n=1 Tax=Nocardia rhizosphaerihabitans TaxID=1691570 RepID=UPI00367269B1